VAEFGHYLLLRSGIGRQLSVVSSDYDGLLVKITSEGVKDDKKTKKILVLMGI